MYLKTSYIYKHSLYVCAKCEMECVNMDITTCNNCLYLFVHMIYLLVWIMIRMIASRLMVMATFKEKRKIRKCNTHLFIFLIIKELIALRTPAFGPENTLVYTLLEIAFRNPLVFCTLHFAPFPSIPIKYPCFMLRKQG